MSTEVSSILKKILIMALTSLGGYGVKEIRNISQNVRELNIRIGVLTERMSETVDNYESLRGDVLNLKERIERCENSSKPLNE
jgi:hypothetical protein